MNGLLVVDKPRGMSSREALNRVQKWFPRKTKVGHTGTLDPLATGVLVVCLGAATRLADFVQAMGKCYDARIRLGATSDTDDADGAILENTSAAPPTREQVEAALAAFVGTIDQFPPSVSALKVGGHRAHELARKGRSVPLAARSVTITSIRVHRYEWPFLDASIDCGKGTYIRSIARDLGVALGVGGLVEQLRRSRVGPFTVESAVTLGATAEAVLAKVQPVTAPIAGMVRVTITAEDEARFRCGQALPLPPDWGGSVEAAVLDERGELVGIADADGGLRPRIVLAKRP